MDRDRRLNKDEWFVAPVGVALARSIVEANHYARGASNTATYLHGLYRSADSFFGQECFGVAWWIPPTKSAALATFPENWRGVLSLSRFVVVPGVPKNACTFLLSRSRKMIDRSKWPCLVTYADTWRGHSGTIYKADNWTYCGLTGAGATFTLNGVMVSRKAGPKTRTRSQMAALGATFEGNHRKHKYVHIVRLRTA